MAIKNDNVAVAIAARQTRQGNGRGTRSLGESIRFMAIDVN
jgi:hypothetical protein